MHRVVAAVGATLVSVVLSGCGDPAGPAVLVSYPSPGPETACRTATLKVLQVAGGLVDPEMDAAKVRSRVANGAPECIGFDRPSLERIYAAVATDYLANPRGEASATDQACRKAVLALPERPIIPDPPAACATTGSDRYRQYLDERAEQINAAERTSENACRTAIRKVVRAGVEAERRGEDRAAAEDRVLDVLEKDKPCRGVPRSRQDLLHRDAKREFAKP